VRTRREFLIAGGAGLCIFAAPLAAQQPPGKIAVIGRLSPVSASVDTATLEAFRKGLRELGWAEGRNLSIETRFAEGNLDWLPGLAAELVRSKVDLIVGMSSQGALAAKNATPTIPIVFAMTGDPVESGLVASLARPGGNLTGVTALGLALSEKRLELLREAVPGVRHVSVLLNPPFPDSRLAVKKLQGAAHALGVQLRVREVHDHAGIEKAFAAMRDERAGALLVLTDPLFLTHRKRIVELAAWIRLPAVYAIQGYVDVGGLMFYGESLPDMHRRAAVFVDKILKGAKPSELPVEQATKFELVVNMKTAKALGIKIPQSVLVRAGRVIE
jgi:putative ABC transport system substrate-binding protein